MCYQPYRVLRHKPLWANVNYTYVHTVYLVCACGQRCYSPGSSLLLCPSKTYALIWSVMCSALNELKVKGLGLGPDRE